MAAFFILLVVAGNETTRNAISHGLLAMTEHPDQRALWQADPAGIAATGVDEIVRWGSPVIWMRRTVAADTVLGGTRAAPRATRSSCSTTRPTGTRTSSRTPSPSTCGATPTPTSASARPGRTSASGAHLARQEIDVMFRQLFERLPDIEAVGEPDRLLSPFINGIKHLDCSFTPANAG